MLGRIIVINIKSVTELSLIPEAGYRQITACPCEVEAEPCSRSRSILGYWIKCTDGFPTSEGVEGTVGMGGQWTRHKGTILGIIEGLGIKESNQPVVGF